MRVFPKLLVGGAIAVAVMLPSAAFAGTGGTAHGVTSADQHPDTTSVSGPATISTPDGPVWAYDNLRFSFTSVKTGTDTYLVQIDATGTFKGFADPNTGNALVSHGTVRGWLDETVTSPTPPKGAYLPALEPSAMSQGDMVEQFFGGAATSVIGGHYDYKYNKIAGHLYEQQG